MISLIRWQWGGLEWIRKNPKNEIIFSDISGSKRSGYMLVYTEREVPTIASGGHCLLKSIKIINSIEDTINKEVEDWDDQFLYQENSILPDCFIKNGTIFCSEFSAGRLIGRGGANIKMLKRYLDVKLEIFGDEGKDPRCMGLLLQSHEYGYKKGMYAGRIRLKYARGNNNSYIYKIYRI